MFAKLDCFADIFNIGSSVNVIHFDREILLQEREIELVAYIFLWLPILNYLLFLLANQLSL